MMLHRFTAAVFLFSLCCIAVLAQQPSFRSSAELLAIDVTVVDDRGVAIRDLKPEDFIVEVAGQRRKVVRSDFIDFAERERALANAAPAPGVASNQVNAHLPDPRLIMLLVDDESFTVEQGRRVFVDLADAIEHAFTGDMLAFAPLSGQGQSVDFTTDRRPVADALRKLQGKYVYVGNRTDLGVKEALEIRRGSALVTDLAVERECLSAATYTLESRGGAGGACGGALRADAALITTTVHDQTHRALRSLARQFDALGGVPGVKYLLFVSRGIYLDEDIGVSEELARLARAASVTLQVLHVGRQDPGDVARMRPSPKASEDALFRKAGLETVATAAGGNVEEAATESVGAFDRIQRQIATVYRLGVETIPEDASGGTKPITVTTTRHGVAVHTHRQVVVPDRTATSPKARLERALASPLVERGIGMRMSAFGYRSSDGGGNIVVSAEADARPDALRLAYVVRNSAGTAVVASEVAPEAVTTTEGMPPLAVFRTTAPLGDYTVKFAAVDTEGRVGSVIQSVSLPRGDTPGFALGDLVVLPEGGDVLHSRPSARIPGASREASVYFELYSGGPSPATTASVVMDVSDVQTGAPQGTTREQVTLTRAAGYNSAAAHVRFSPATLLPGEYVVRVSVEGTNVSASRRFTVE